MVWARTDLVGSAGPGAAAIADLFSSFQATAGLNLFGVTVVRTRGVVSARTATGATGLNELIVGCRVGTENSPPLATTGGPFTNRDADWYVYEPVPLPADGADVDKFVWKEVDNRAKRKVDEVGQTVFLAVEPTATTIQFGGFLSTLIMLP